MNKLLRYGNHKIPKTTAIFNMSSAKDCAAAKLNLCPVIKKGIPCYARKTEKCRSMGYDMVVKHRRRQEKYWDKHSAANIADNIVKILQNKRVDVDKFRFNESGDFKTQKDVRKMSIVAKRLKNAMDIISYGYTSRSDLDFSKANFLVKGSEHNKGNNGRVQILDKGESVPKGYYLCPGSCKKCTICSTNNKQNIAIRRH